MQPPSVKLDHSLKALIKLKSFIYHYPKIRKRIHQSYFTLKLLIGYIIDNISKHFNVQSTTSQTTRMYKNYLRKIEENYIEKRKSR